MISITLFLVLPLKELLGLLQALTEIVRLDIPTLVITSDSQTRCVGWPYFQTPVLLLFGRQLPLVLSLLIVGGG